MTSKDIKEIIKTAVSLFLICAVLTGILAGVNSVTAPAIEQNNKKAAELSRVQVLPNASAFKEITFSDGRTGYEGVDGNGETVGFVFTCSASGYGGTLEVMSGINKDGAVTGINILTINETPGLGMNAKKDSFKNSFLGKTGQISVVKNSEPQENEIAAITSATITSNAVTKCVNEALGLYKVVTEKGE